MPPPPPRARVPNATDNRRINRRQARTRVGQGPDRADTPPPANLIDTGHLASRLLIGGWLSQFLLAGVIGMAAPIPVRPLVIERRYCNESQQNALMARYRALVWRDKLGIERFRPVILYSVFGRQQSNGLPAASALGLTSAAGDGNRQEAAQVQDNHPTALVLRCQQELGSSPAHGTEHLNA